MPKAVGAIDLLSENVEVTGPIALYWYASIESKGAQGRSWRTSKAEIMQAPTNDTDWYLKVKNMDVDGAERSVAEDWLRAFYYKLDERESKAQCGGNINDF